MKQVKYMALAMIVCGLFAMAVGMSFLFSNPVSAKPDKGEEAYIIQGNSYLNDGEYIMAVASYKKALNLNEANVEALEGIAEAYSSINYYMEEENVREDLSKTDPDNLENWIKLVMVKMKQNQLDDAKALTEELRAKYEDDNLEALYHQMDVREPVFNLTSGSYDSYQLLTLQEIPDNAVIYYTVDGSEPTEFSDVFTDAIILSYPENIIKAKAVGFIGYESNVVELNCKIMTPIEKIKDSDLNFEWLFRDKLDKEWDEPIYNYELAQFRSIYILGDYHNSIENPTEATFFADGYVRYQNKYTEWGKTDLKILSYMPFLKTLYIGYQQSVDLSYLSELTYLEELSLLNNSITDIRDLDGLKNLKKLALGWNNISDVSPLAGLSNLESLGLWDNQISDVSCLMGMSNLVYFDITGNQVQNISCIRSMPKLTELWIARNQISDMTPIDSCENLSVLMMADNPDGGYSLEKKKADKLIKTDK